MRTGVWLYPAAPARSLIDAIVAGARQAKVEVGVCGEFAGSAEGARLLIERGIRELSMDPAALDEVREALR